MTKKNNNHVIAIVGPTASGKTSLAVEIAKYFDTEIISADSRQIYKEFNIATAKPTIEEMQGIKHHLTDCVKPTDEFTVANFADEAKKVINNLFLQKKIPVIVGGTGLYFRILLEAYDLPRVAPNKELRSELHEIEKQQGASALHKILQQLDPQLALTMHPNNTVKIIRAIEVSKTLGIPMSQAQKKKEQQYDIRWFGLGHLNGSDRQFLYERTDNRVDVMIEKGLEKEAWDLYKKYGKINSLQKTIGYQEFIDYFEKNISYSECIEKIKQNTRRYAKRQLTWFRRNEDIYWLDIKDTTGKNLIENCLSSLNDLL